MNIYYIVLVFFLTAKISFGQNLDKVDSITSKYKINFYTSPKRIAKRINRDFESELEKARAIYTFIALNIEYNRRAERFIFKYKNRNKQRRKLRKRKEYIARYTLKQGIAVCEGYSILFKHLADIMGLECQIVTGRSKGNKTDLGKLPSINHSWNEIKIDGKWYLIDVTWGSGFVNNNKYTPSYNDFYFQTDPIKFYLSHHPTDGNKIHSTYTDSQFKMMPLYSSYFLSSEMELVFPEIGEINLEGEEIKIGVRGEVGDFYYNYGISKAGQKIQVSYDGDVMLLKIPTPKDQSKYLNIYHNRQHIVTFLIIRKK